MKLKAVKITEKLLKGTTLIEEVPVKLIGGTIGLLTIRALGEGEIPHDGK